MKLTKRTCLIMAVLLAGFAAGCANKADQGVTISQQELQTSAKADTDRIKGNEHLNDKQKATAMSAVEGARLSAAQNAPPRPPQ